MSLVCAPTEVYDSFLERRAKYLWVADAPIVPYPEVRSLKLELRAKSLPRLQADESLRLKEEVDAKIAANRAMIKERKKGIPYTTIATAQGQILFSGMLPVQAKAEGLADMLLEWSDNAEQLAASATTAAAPPVEAS